MSRRLHQVLLMLLLFLGAAPQAFAAGITLLRDADIETSLDRLAAPVLQAAGLNAGQMRILVVDDAALNAFVLDPETIFITAGMIEKLTRPAQLQAVIAHEAGHIAYGHLSRRAGNYGTARTAAGLGAILGVAAGALSGSAEAGIAIIAGSSQSAKRRFLSHTRAEESSADLASVRYLDRAGLDVTGAIEVQQIFRGQELVSVDKQDPYRRSHPASRDRLRALNAEAVGVGGVVSGDSVEALYWFARAQSKLSGFRRAPSWTLRQADNSPYGDLAEMRRAIAYHRQAKTDEALKAMNLALNMRPGDGYLLELRGQIQLEARAFSAAAGSYKKAVALLPKEPLIRAGYGRALLALGRDTEALRELEVSLSQDPANAHALRDLAQAYARNGQPAMASLVTAERYALRGSFKDAEIHATRASDRLPHGSGPWKRAQDVLDAAQRAKQ